MAILPGSCADLAGGLGESIRRTYKERMRLSPIVDSTRWKAGTLFAEAAVAETEERPKSLAGIDEAIHACRRCPIGLLENQAVMGEGPRKAALMIVGEQPGDQEDLAGRPFVGPAGKVLNA